MAQFHKPGEISQFADRTDDFNPIGEEIGEIGRFAHNCRKVAAITKHGKFQPKYVYVLVLVVLTKKNADMHFKEASWQK